MAFNSCNAGADKTLFDLEVSDGADTIQDSDGMSVWPSTVAMLVLTQHCPTLRSVMVLTAYSVTLNSYHDGANMKLCDPVGQ